jgi:hypothetical protein
MTVSTRRRILQKLETLDAEELPSTLQAIYDDLDRMAQFRAVYRMLNPPDDEQRDGTVSARG